MPRGGNRREKSAAVKLAEGDKGKGRREIRMDQPDPIPCDPVMPPDLTGDAALHWGHLCDILRGERRLSMSHGPMLASACLAYAEWIRLERAKADVPPVVMKVTIDGAGQEHEEPKAHPLYTMTRQARQAYRLLLNDLCLSPATIARAKVNPDQPEADPLAEFLGPRRITA